MMWSAANGTYGGLAEAAAGCPPAPAPAPAACVTHQEKLHLFCATARPALSPCPLPATPTAGYIDLWASHAIQGQQHMQLASGHAGCCSAPGTPSASPATPSPAAAAAAPRSFAPSSAASPPPGPAPSPADSCSESVSSSGLNLAARAAFGPSAGAVQWAAAGAAGACPCPSCRWHEPDGLRSVLMRALNGGAPPPCAMEWDAMEEDECVEEGEECTSGSTTESLATAMQRRPDLLRLLMRCEERLAAVTSRKAAWVAAGQPMECL
jgi:hypothetical protein